MKPRKLTIEGLNSFIDKQDIDFEKLTSKNLFGIFGPTGSGKSSILDAITLAIYGEISRKSTNYINTNTNSVTVSYEFSISNNKERKIYRAERNIKRDKNGKIQTKYARLIEVTEDGDKIIAEKATEVKKQCEKIIGLTLDDFTRSVVLPQGKFSEFLKLKGIERRNMLERIFALEKYGSKLIEKIRAEKKLEETELNILTGELKRYSGMTYELYEEKLKELEDSKKEEAKLRLDKVDFDKDFEEKKNIWNTQIECRSFEEKKSSLLNKQEEIEKKKNNLLKAESSLKIKPTLDDYENTLKQIKENDFKFKEIEESLNRTLDKLKVAKESFEEISNYKDENYPKFIARETELNSALELEESLLKIKKERDDLKKEYSEINNNCKDNKAVLEKKLEDMEILRKVIKNNEVKIEEIKFPPELKEKFQRTLNLEEKFKDLSNRKNKFEKDIELKKAIIEKEKQLLKENSLKKEEKLKLLEELNNKFEILLENPVGDEELLLKKQEEITILNQNILNLKKDINSFSELSKNLSTISGEKEQLVVDYNNLKVKIEEKTKFLEELDNSIALEERNNLANILRESLQEGQPCPVCGSNHHVKLEDINYISEDLDSLKKNRENLKRELESLNATFRAKETEKAIKENNIKALEKDIESLKESIGSRELDKEETKIKILTSEFEKLKLAMETWNKEKATLEKTILEEDKFKGNLEKDEIKSKETLKQQEEYKETLERDLKDMEESFSVTYEKLLSLKEDIKKENHRVLQGEDIEELEGVIKKLNEFEKKRESLEKEIKLNREELEKLEKNKEELETRINDFKTKLSNIEVIGKEKSSYIEEKEKAIFKVTEGKDLKILIHENKKSIESINENFEKSKKFLENLDKEEKTLSEENLKLKEQGKSLEEIKNQRAFRLQELLLEEAMDMDEVYKNILSKEEMLKLKEEIKSYEDTLKEISITIENLKKKLQGNSLESEEWLKLQEDKKEIENLLDSKIKFIAALEKEVAKIEENLKELKELQKKYDELNHNFNLLNDLDKLVQGNKFVEFVAMSQLKYIALEASKRLKEISSERYGLELDEDGNFIIRDDKNGGALRDASTLSGGETFITSLALALALSSQIQLKGSVPLEFFFLDEGFGTLDNDLLEVVMNSLERLHNDRLAIGIISHVEEIKNRIPVKLIVKPAKPGEGGTKVKLEYS